MLGAPIDKGFNRLAWLFPYLMGATGAVAGRLRRGEVVAASPTRRAARRAASIRRLEERLDDELRDLD